MNIHSPLELFEEQDRLYLVYEELLGGSLLDLLNACIQGDSRLTNEEIGTIIYQLAAALNFMHGKGFVHRDLKPENVGFEKENDCRSIKLTSFLTVKRKPEGEKLLGVNGSVTGWLDCCSTCTWRRR